jgi:hypothetical protein
MATEIECMHHKLKLYSRQYLKGNKINYSHLNAVRRVFLDVDESGEKLGIISKREFLLKIAEEGF